MVFTKDPSATLDYKFDWKALTNGNGLSDWLSAGVTISTKLITADTGITADAGTLADTNTTVIVRISGGTVGNDYNVACRITTSGGEIDERAIVVQVRDT